MKMNLKKLLAVSLLAALFLGTLFGCGSSTASTADNTQGTAASTAGAESTTDTVSDAEDIVLRVAYRRADPPMTFQNDAGEPDGALGKIFAIVDEYLEGYTFEYIATDNEDLNLGLASGDYDIGLFNAAYTPDRAATYVYPTEYYGASNMVLVVRNEDADIDTIDKFVAAGYTTYDLIPNNGITVALEQWNEYHPDTPLAFGYRDSSAVNTSYADIANGIIDGNFVLASQYQAQVVAEDGAFNEYADQLTANFVLAMKTYPLLSPLTVGADEAFVTAISEAILKAREDPRTVEISLEYYGDNFLEYPYGEGW